MNIFENHFKEIENLVLKNKSQLNLNNIDDLKNVSLEKYGRLLADVYLNELCLNNWMLENKYAVEYHGKTKQTFKPTTL